METTRETTPLNEKAQVSWSILDGEFKPSADWPNLEEVQIIKSRSVLYKTNQEVQWRIYYTELLLYALRYTNPSLIDVSVPEKQVVKSLIDEVSGIVHKLDEKNRKEFIREIAETEADPPFGDPKEIPVMQALKAMQEAGTIDYESRTILDAVVRAVHIKQSSDRSNSKDVQ